MAPIEKKLISGREFSEDELIQVRETVAMFGNLSRRELALTLCEHLSWVAPNGRPKLNSCLKFLARLEEEGQVVLPPKRWTNPRGKERRVEVGRRTDPPSETKQEMAEVVPLQIEPVLGSEAISLWNEYVARYHPIGYARPFGAHQRYFIRSRQAEILGCLLFAASAWAVADRDEWIGWSEADRKRHLHLVVNNTRYLLLPWVRIRNLASKVLALTVRRLVIDWEQRYGYVPVLLETFVDPAHYRGTCYRAANWIDVGKTAGRGRMDRHTQYLSTPKRIYVYPLRPDFRAWLCGSPGYKEVGG